MYRSFLSTKRPLVRLGMRHLLRPLEEPKYFFSNSYPHFNSDKESDQNQKGRPFDSTADGLKGMGESFKGVARKLREIGPDIERVSENIKPNDGGDKNELVTLKQQFERFRYRLYALGFFSVSLAGAYLVKNKVTEVNRSVRASKETSADKVVERKNSLVSKEQLLAEIKEEFDRIQVKLNDSFSSYRIAGFFGLSRGSAHQDKLRALNILRAEINNTKEDSEFKCSPKTRKLLMDAYDYWPEEEDKRFKQNFIEVHLKDCAENFKVIPGKQL